MKIAFRNFLTTLRRYKASSLLNVIGLTIAFTAFYIIVAEVRRELTFNRSFPDAERIYLIEIPNWYVPGDYSSWLHRPVPERAIASDPAVESGGCMLGGINRSMLYLPNASGAGFDKFTIGTAYVSLPFLDVFSFRAVAGDVRDLAKPGGVIVSRSAAERLGIGVGDTVWAFVPNSENAREVVAVFEDFPDNSLLSGCEMVFDLGSLFLDDGSEYSFSYFIKLHPGADPAAFVRRYEAVHREMVGDPGGDSAVEAEEGGSDEALTAGVRLSPLARIYFESDATVPFPKGSAATTYPLLFIAVLVILLAFINFVNFFFALVPVRIRTVNTFKVFGAPTSSLRFSFVFEALGLVAVSLAAALYAAYALSGTLLAGYISASLSLSDNLPVVAILFLTAFGMALAATLYPAWYITSFAPAMVVRGSFSGTRSGRRLRLSLLGVQFFISLCLIISTLFIGLQHRYMMNYDMGFDKRNLLAVRVEAIGGNYETLRGKLLADPRIVDVTGASGPLVETTRMGWGILFKGENINFQTYVVEWNFPRMMGIPLLEGRDFSMDDRHKGTYIFNRTAAEKYAIEVGDRITAFESPDEQVVGICEDFNFRPLQYEVTPFAFYIRSVQSRNGGWKPPVCIYVRTTEGVDRESLAAFIRGCVTEVVPDIRPGEIPIRSFEEELGAEYGRERKLMVVVGLFTLLSVVIALMGVFGIVLFETQHRRHEIAVRKVMGASAGEILGMFNRRYAGLVVVCFLLAAPFCAWAVGRWLSAFVARTPLYWWVFAAAFVAVLGITLLTVTVRSWRAASENPADTVKNE